MRQYERCSARGHTSMCRLSVHTTSPLRRCPCGRSSPSRTQYPTQCSRRPRVPTAGGVLPEQPALVAVGEVSIDLARLRRVTLVPIRPPKARGDLLYGDRMLRFLDAIYVEGHLDIRDPSKSPKALTPGTRNDGGRFRRTVWQTRVERRKATNRYARQSCHEERLRRNEVSGAHARR